MIICLVLIALLSGWALFLTMRHNIHMLQLNGYKNDEHLRWIGKNLRQQWILGFGIVLGVVRLFYAAIWLDILILLTLWLDIIVYRAMKRMHTKKKLVYTARVKRLIATILLLVIALAVGGYLLGGVPCMSGVCILCVSLQWFLNLIANLVNRPVELAISKYYIRDAVKMLRSRKDLTIIGVTGSYGKTSMKFYLQTLLQSKYSVLVTPGNFNTPLGVTRTVREHLKPTHQIFICEMGARRVGEIKEICDMVHPQYGIITSVGPQHLETFHSIENIQKTKFELADAVPKDSKIFLNGDNAYIQEQASAYENKVFYYSEGKGAGYYAEEISVSQFGTDFTLVTPSGESERFQMRLIGIHNVINVTGAIAVAHELGIALKDLRIPVRRLQPVEHRMQLREHGLVTIIDDAYNSNPVGSKAAVETLAMFDGIRILVTPGMVELGAKEAEYNYKFGTYAAKCCDYVLLVGKKHTAPIREGVLSEGFLEERCLVFDKLEDAMAYAYTIKGTGHKYILLENDLPDNY